VPADLEEWKRTGSTELPRLQERVREEFTKWFAKGFAAVGVRKTGAGTDYLLAPWSDF